MIEITETAEGCLLPVRVQPRSSCNQIVGEIEGALKVKLTAPPVEGEANQELCTFLAAALGIPRTRVSLKKGQASKQKLIRIAGMSAHEVLSRLGL